MSNYEDVYAPDLEEETLSTLSGSEQFVMFDSVEGKRAELSAIADYIVANGEIDGSDIPTIVSTIEGNIGTLDTKVGDLTNLDTTSKTSIVSAVNEVNGKADTANEHVGDLSELETEDKTSAVDAINEVLSKIPVMTKEVTGNPIVVDDALNADVVSLGVELEPVQDLHGYDKPWAAGAGKNKLKPYADGTTETQAGMTGTANADGSITFNGTTTGTFWGLGDSPSFTLKAGTYTLSQSEIITNLSTMLVRIVEGGDNVVIASVGTTLSYTFTTTEDYTVYFYNKINAGVTLTNKTMYFQLEVGSTATAYEPYSNICPITGYDSVTVGVTDGDTQSHSTTVTLPSTVYGGTVGVTSGTGTSTMANIASYNGETINEPWLSSMDEYSPGATPTTGAQVVYTLATPTDLTTTPTDITLYNGDNTVSADGDMDMVYVRDIVKVIEKLEG